MIGSDVFGPEQLGRLAEMPGEQRDVAAIGTLVFTARLRICISSIMRWRSGVMDSSSAGEVRDGAQLIVLQTGRLGENTVARARSVSR